MKKPHLLGKFGTVVITEPEQPNPLGPVWDKRTVQADKGRWFETRMSGAPLAAGRIVFIEVGRPVRVEGIRTKEIQVLRFLLAGGERDMRIDARQAANQTALMLPPESQVTLRTDCSTSLHFQIPKRKLDRAAGWNETDRPFPAVEIPEKEGCSLRELAVVACRQLEQLPDQLRANFARNFENLLAIRWAAAILAQLPDLRRPDPMIGRRRVADLCEWAALDRDDPLSVGDLAARCGIGIRALQKNFLRHFDTTPHLFLRNLRLEKVRRLLRHETARWTVTAAAYEAGFTHMGRFAAQYRGKFGEMPGETVRQARKRGG